MFYFISGVVLPLQLSLDRKNGASVLVKFMARLGARVTFRNFLFGCLLSGNDLVPARSRLPRVDVYVERRLLWSVYGKRHFYGEMK